MHESKLAQEQQHLSSRLLTLYDDFSEFDAYCAFFCDAVACLSSSKEDWLDDAGAQGLGLFSQWLKGRSAELKRELDVAFQSASSQ